MNYIIVRKGTGEIESNCTDCGFYYFEDVVTKDFHWNNAVQSPSTHVIAQIDDLNDLDKLKEITRTPIDVVIPDGQNQGQIRRKEQKAHVYKLDLITMKPVEKSPQ